MAAKGKFGSPKTMRALALWQGVTAAALKDMPFDLSARQTAVLLTIYMEPGPHSVKSLAKHLSISKPAICRAIDVLEHAKLIRRMPDRRDLRSVLILRTPKGSTYLHSLANIILQASKVA